MTTNLPEDMQAFIIDDNSELEKITVKPTDFVIPSGTIILFKQ